MKTLQFVPAVLSLALALTACSNSDHYTTLANTVEQQNKTILEQQQTLLNQQQKLIDQEISLAVITERVTDIEDILKKMQDQTAAATPAAPATPTTPSKVDEHKVAVVRLLTGFSARLAANIGYGAYSDGLSDLNSNLVQSMFDIKDQSFIDEANRILCLYNYAGDFWQRFSTDGAEEIRLTPSDRYKFANVGVNFVDNYNPRPSDVKKFWVAASDELQKLMDYNSEALGRDANSIRLFAK